MQKKKVCPVISLPSQRNFSISFKRKVALAKFVGKCKNKKSGIMKSGLDAMPLILLDDLLIGPLIEGDASNLQLG